MTERGGVHVHRQAIFEKIVEERERQNALHPEWHGHKHGLVVLAEEFGEVAKALYELGRTASSDLRRSVFLDEWEVLMDARVRELKEEIVQVAAVCIGWLSDLD
jgi:NTP pyrophosphatase (non-canonical NTP hydrolase)